MSGDTSAFGFGKFIPGFEFLQGLAQGAGAAASPLGRVPQWVAPTVSVEEVDKRIADVHLTYVQEKDRFAAELEKFVAAIQGQGEVAATGEEGVITMRLLDAIYKSSEENAEVEV